MRYIINNNRKNKLYYKINKNIKFEKVRLIGKDGEQLGVFLFEEAISRSISEKLDLVLIDSKKNPPICKITNYGKFIYEKNKFFKTQKKKQQNFQLKEIKINQNIEEKDYQIKLKKIKDFLINKKKVRIILKFKGREIVHNEIGFNIFNRIKNELDKISIVEFMSNKIEGRQIIMILLFKKK